MIVKSFMADKLQVRISDTSARMGADAAAQFALWLKDTLKHKQSVNVIFAAAPSQLDFLEALSREKGIDWRRVRAFHMDEYIGVGASQPQSFNGFVRKYVADKMGVGEFYGMRGDAPDVSAECARYSELLTQYPPDAVCLGIGENGHIAFNDPWEADLWDAQNVKTVKLDEKCRNQQVHDKCFARLEDVPRYAITLTVPMMMRAKAMFCVVPGAQKANAVQKAVKGAIGTDCPATALRLHDNARLFCDMNSGGGLLEGDLPQIEAAADKA